MSERVSDSGARFATCCGRRASHLRVRGLLLHGLRFHLDLHAVAHEHSAGFQGLVPAQPPFAAIDLRSCREAGALLPPWILPESFERRLEGHRHRCAADFEVARNREAVAFLLVRPANLRAPEGNVRMFLDVEKIRGPQVRVTIRNSRVDARRVDADLHAGRGGVSLVDVNCPGEALEAAANRREHHVLDRELDRGVRRVELPNRYVVHAEPPLAEARLSSMRFKTHGLEARLLVHGLSRVTRPEETPGRATYLQLVVRVLRLASINCS